MPPIILRTSDSCLMLDYVRVINIRIIIINRIGLKARAYVTQGPSLQKAA